MRMWRSGVQQRMTMLEQRMLKKSTQCQNRACRMSVPIVIWPCGEAVALLSARHFTTMEVDDMDTCHSTASLLNKSPVKCSATHMRNIFTWLHTAAPTPMRQRP